MLNINVTIQGVTPILCNRFTEEAQAKMEAGTAAVMIGRKGTPREQAERKLYMDSQGRPVIPGPNVFRSIIDAGSYHKAGKSKITTNKSSLVPAGVALEQIECEIFDPTGADPSWEVDSRAVVVPSTGGRIMAHRPRFDRWALRFDLEVDTSMFDEKIVRVLVDDAGRRIGLGDFRPSRKGPFGRFVVTGWRAEERKSKAA